MANVTQAEIARQVGISQQAVGYALGNYRNSRIKLREETRQRIIKTADELGYRPHRYAQVMRRGRSGVIGFIQFGGMLQAAIERGMYAAKAIHEAGFRLNAEDLLWYRDGFRSACDAILEARVEGVILCDPISSTPVSQVQRILEARIPVVTISGVRFPHVPQVRSDVRQGMRDMTRHLIGLGHKKLCLLVGRSPLDTSEDTGWPSLDRVAGFRDAVENAGLSRNQAEVFYQDNPHDMMIPYEVGKQAMQTILGRRDRPGVFVCSNDDWAIGALAACAEAGVRVPEEMAVTGFDNTGAGRFSMVPLTTVAQQPELMGRRAVEVLVKLIRGQKLKKDDQLIKTPCDLVVRKSCGAEIRQ